MVKTRDASRVATRVLAIEVPSDQSIASIPERCLRNSANPLLYLLLRHADQVAQAVIMPWRKMFSSSPRSATVVNVNLVENLVRGRSATRVNDPDANNVP